jgi:uncharacterized protein YndB with AHSA1/START domain
MTEKKKFELEYMMNTSVRVLYNMLSTPSGLAEWFADDVNIRGDVFTFIWDGEEEKARLLGKRMGEFVRFQWVEQTEEKTFFEFRISEDPLTGEVALLITDFAADDEMEDARMLWNQHVGFLRQTIGSQV